MPSIEQLNLDYANTREWLEKVTMQRNKALDERDGALARAQAAEAEGDLLKAKLANQYQEGAEAFRDATKAALEDRGDEQKHALRAAHADIKKLRDEMAELRKEILGKGARIIELTEMHAQLYRELDAMMSRNRYLSEKNDGFVARHTELNRQIGRMREWLDLLYKRASAARKEAWEGEGDKSIKGVSLSDPEG